MGSEFKNSRKIYIVGRRRKIVQLINSFEGIIGANDWRGQISIQN